MTVRLSTASLNCVVVAPLDEDSWYGICTPCSIVASRWLVATTRGVDMIAARAFGLQRRELEVDEVARSRGSQSAIEPAGFATGRFTL